MSAHSVKNLGLTVSIGNLKMGRVMNISLPQDDLSMYFTELREVT